MSANNHTKVSVLFARHDSIYKELGCDVWDALRDARLFASSNPVIAHPPCRAWGQLKHMAKPRRGERALALIALDWVRRNGGVLEHPLRSSLFSAVIGRPQPPDFDCWGGWTMVMNQHWLGHRAEKATRLYLCGISPKQLPPFPIELKEPTHTVDSCGKRKTAHSPARPLIGKSEREATPLQMAEWLIDICRQIKT